MEQTFISVPTLTLQIVSIVKYLNVVSIADFMVTDLKKVYNNGNAFPESRELIDIIQSFGWSLYDVSNPPKGRAHTWEEMDKMTPAQSLEIGRQYTFIQKPENDQTLRDAYSVTKGLGPSLRIDNPKDDRWLEIIMLHESPALFTRLFFLEEFAAVTSPETYYLSDPDFVAIKYDKLVDTFRRYFRIVKPEEYGLQTPVPMPQIH